MKKTGVKFNLSAAIILSMVFGAVAGLVGKDQMQNIKFLGDIFFRLIQMCVIPLVFCQIVEAVGGLEKGQLSSTGLKAIASFLISSLLAAGFGVFMACVCKPGTVMRTAVADAGEAVQAVSRGWQDTLLAFIPDNIIKAMGNGAMMQVIVIALFVGAAISYYRSKHEKCRFYDLVHEVNGLILHIIRVVMYMAPIGIFSYVASTVGSMGAESLLLLVKYLLVFGAAVVIFMVLWLLVVSVTCKLDLLKLIRKMIPMSFMALATTSSAITLPLEMEDAKQKIGISSRIADLVLPLGMPLNSNGAAMHMAITAITIAQMYGFDFSFEKLIYVAIISVFLSLANAVVPGAALVSLAMIVPQLGLPAESIAIFAGAEYIVGMYRTILNVDSDVFCALLVAKSENAIDYDVFQKV